VSDYNGQDLGKDISKQTGRVGKKVLNNRIGRKMVGKAFKLQLKLLKFIFQKVILTILKAIAGFLGPWGLVILLVIILLLIVIDSISIFDTNQGGGQRTEAEVLFDETIKEVVQEKTDNLAGSIFNDLNEIQPAGEGYPQINYDWLNQITNILKPSWAVPSVLFYYDNLKDENYKPWHKEYAEKDVSTASKRAVVKSEFTNIISNKYDYFFSHPSLKLSVTTGQSGKEYVETKTTKSCTKREFTEDGQKIEETLPDVVTTSKKELPAREIIDSATLLYSKVTFSYKEYDTDWKVIRNTTVEDVNQSCQITVEEKKKLQVIDDSVPPIIEHDPNSLVSFFLADNPEGELARLVKPRDLEYVMEMAKEVDPVFPSLNIEYEKIITCAKKNSIESCIGKYVLGGSFGSGFGPGGMWYPEAYKEIYERAAKAYGIDWWILASIHGQETSFSTNPAASNPELGSKDASGNFIGARGHFQFMPRSWMGWAFTGSSTHSVTKLGNITGPLEFIMDPGNISRYGGFGVDATGDGKASPWNLEDAAFTAANLLKSNGYKKGNESAIKKAIGSYNHSSAYVSEVWNRGIMFKEGPVAGKAVIPIADGVFTFPTTGRITTPFGPRSGGHNGIDIGGGGRNYTVPIVSVADGMVEKAYLSDTYGWVVFIKHDISGTPFETVYAHLVSQPMVTPGQSVKKGQQLGNMGNTGKSTGKHLHFEMHSPSWNNAKSNKLSPLLYIPKPPEK
jgi:hypothetical protein